MSQSDYLQNKKTAIVLRNVSKLSPVLMSGEYTEFRGYSLDKQINNSKVVFSKLIQPNYNRKFDMDLRSNSCSATPLCNKRFVHSTYASTPLISTPIYFKKNPFKLPMCICPVL